MNKKKEKGKNGGFNPASLDHDISDIIKSFKAIGTGTGIAICFILWYYGPHTVNGLAEKIKLSSPAITLRLQQLRAAGIVDYTQSSTTTSNFLVPNHWFVALALIPMFIDRFPHLSDSAHVQLTTPHAVPETIHEAES